MALKSGTILMFAVPLCERTEASEELFDIACAVQDANNADDIVQNAVGDDVRPNGKVAETRLQIFAETDTNPKCKRGRNSHPRLRFGLVCCGLKCVSFGRAEFSPKSRRGHRAPEP